VQVGVVFPQREIGSDPLVIRDLAQAAESLGYSHLLAYDHVLGASHDRREPPLSGPYTEHDEFHEPLTLFGFLCATTTTLGFATGVLVLPQRQTALVAKQAAAVAVLSHDRLRLGVGVGWNHVEYTALGADFHTRGRLLDEQVAVLRDLWSGRVVDIAGRFHRIDRASIAPSPAAPIPIWFGGRGDVAFSRAARLGDGFILPRFPKSDDADGTVALKELVERAARVRELVDAAGRDAPFGLEGRVELALPRDRWEADLRAQAAAGITHVCLNTMDAGLTHPREHIEALETFAAEVQLGDPSR